MKKITYLLILVMAVLYSCKGEDSVDPNLEAQNEVISELQGDWHAVEARKDNTIISDFSDFSLTVSEMSYTTQNGSPVWPQSGSFNFETTETIDDFVRQDGRLFTASVNGGQLNLTIIYQENTARGLYGTYEFTLGKN